MPDTLLQLTSIDKSFFGVRVLKDVCLKLNKGQTLGLVGENGAGKSTLMNILGGNLQPNGGRMTIDGAAYEPRSPRDADHAGVTFIHQELNLFANLTIAENLFLTQFPSRFSLINNTEICDRTRDVLQQVGLVHSPNTRVETLSAGERQLVEIASALNQDSRIIILDEPTTSLTDHERERLFELLTSLQQRGIAMVYISHALHDVRRLCREVVVLRDGAVVGSGPISDFDSSRIVQLMVGRQVDQQFPDRTGSPTDEAVLDVRHVSQPGIVQDVSFAVHRGEVLGIAGLMGSGRTELARIIFGLDPMSSGEVALNGQSLTNLPTRSRVQRGMALLTESRRVDGLCMHASIDDNMSLVSAGRHAAGPAGRLRQRELNSAVTAMSESVHLRGNADGSRPVQTLSGGNQQKVVLGKWLLNDPQVLILDEPTRGIDIGAKFEIYTLIDQRAAAGTGVLVISSEIEELVGLCDRILVLNHGEIKDELTRDDFDSQRILHAAIDVPEANVTKRASSPANKGRASPVKSVGLLLLNQAPLLLFVAVFVLFGSLSDRFLEGQNLVNILIQSSAIAVAAIGMTFVLLTAGVDLSVGSVMFLAVAVTGKLIFTQQPPWLAVTAGIGVGILCGAMNAVLVTRLRVIAFIATLAMLFVTRGFGLWLTNTRAMNMPDFVTEWGASRSFGIPTPVLLMIVVAIVSHILLSRTAWGRQVYAIGNDKSAAENAGIRVNAILFSVYTLCGICAALSGLISLTQTGVVSPSFGLEREFAAIAAAVLGGTSLFGGRGSVLPGTLFGAVLFQTVENGLVVINADPYLHPLILSGVIFVAVLLDTCRIRLVRRTSRRRIRAVDDFVAKVT